MGLIKHQSKTLVKINNIINIAQAKINTKIKLSDKYKIIIPKNSWKLEYNIDSEIFCPFCYDKCEIKMKNTSRQYNSPKVPQLEICNCAEYGEYLKELQHKEIALENNGQIVTHNDERIFDSSLVFYTVFGTTLLIWDPTYKTAINRIFQSSCFRDFVMSEALHQIDHYESVFEFSLDVTPYVIDRYTCQEEEEDNNFIRSIVGQRLKVPYELDNRKDLDDIILKAKNNARKEFSQLKFYFPPKQNVMGAQKVDAEEGIDNEIIENEYRKIKGHLRPYKFLKTIDGDYNTTKLDFKKFSSLDRALALCLLKWCDVSTIANLGRINRWWNKISKMDFLWEFLLKRDFPNSVKQLKFGGYRVLYKREFINMKEKCQPEITGFDPYDNGYVLVNNFT